MLLCPPDPTILQAMELFDPRDSHLTGSPRFLMIIARVMRRFGRIQEEGAPGDEPFRLYPLKL